MNKKVANYQSRVTALGDYDPEKAVPRLHQVIEKSGLKEEEKYRPIRVACSHHKVDNPKHVKGLHDFKIKCRKGEPVDFTDPDNWQQLYNHAHALKQLANAHIKNILT